jgi:CTP:phosphocholine cytidylyltransferase-like protein
MSGISYWSKDDACQIGSTLLYTIKKGDNADLFWDNIVLILFSKIVIRVTRFEDIYEIDNVKELYNLEDTIQSILSI